MLPIVMLAILQPEPGSGEYNPSWATPLGTYSTEADCVNVLPKTRTDYLVAWPTAVLWCASPVDVTYAPETSPRPHTRENP